MTVEGVSVVGAGGHGKVVASTIQATGCRVVAIYDDDPQKQGTLVLGIPVLGSVAALAECPDARVILGVGDNPARRSLAEQLGKRHWVTAVHPRATVHESVTLGEGSVVFAGAVIQPGASLGRHVVVNTGATVDHDCVLEDFAHVGPGAHLSGATVVSEGAFLGTGSATIQGVSIGPWTTVGAGGVVIGNLPGGVVAVGVPAGVVCEEERKAGSGRPASKRRGPKQSPSA